MKVSNFFQLVSTFLSVSVSVALALPQAEISATVDLNAAADPHDQIDWSQHQYQKPGSGDSRGPCPGMNTLANHGFLPRGGKNIGVNDIIEASKLVYNVSPDLTTIAAKVALLTSTNRDNIDSLASIALHGNIEHDVSLSRKDKALGDHIKFDETVYQDLATSSPDKDYYDAESAGKVQKLQLEKARKNNPSLRNTIKEFLIRTRESCFYLSVMGDAITGQAPKKFVDIWFREERLPLAEGWKVPTNEMTPATDAALKKTILQFSEWTAEKEQCNWITLAQGAPEDPFTQGEIFPSP